MKRIYVLCTLVSVWSILGLKAQSTQTEVLAEIENNNKTLKAARQSAQVQKIDAKTGIYPSDIEAEYEYTFGNEASGYKRESELTISQGFDFPTAYIQKHKISNLKSSQADIQYKISRQDILLESKQLCIELVYYNKIKALLDKRLDTAKKLNESYQKRLQIGDANILESNKIALELLNVQSEYRLNETEIENRQQKLSELNGGNNLIFSNTDYEYLESLPALTNIFEKAMEQNPVLMNLRQDKLIASKSIGLAKSLYLPKISVGYKMTVSRPEKAHGFVAGISIPLWENKNTVKLAKAQSILSDLEIDNNRSIQENYLKQLYNKAISLKKSNDDYQALLATQNNDSFLLKALDLGQISLLEYLTEVNFIYQSTENYLQTEKDYHLTLSELLKNDL